MDEVIRLGTLWRMTCRIKDRTPPYDTLPAYELRAPSEAIALDRLEKYRPDLEVVKIDRVR